MNKKHFLLLLLLWAVTVVAETQTSAVPAMIVQSTDGDRQVLQLDATEVTDLVVLQIGQSLSVDIPESQINGVRSITFAMVDADKITTAIESAEAPLVRSVEKVLRDEQVILRLQMQNGAVLEYDIRGNIISKMQ